MSVNHLVLVATVVRYAIWPACLRATGDTRALKHWRNVMMHNMNALFALSEIALMGGVGVRWSHFAVSPLIGIAYVCGSWLMVWNWNKPEYGPQYIYWFFDTTLPGYTTTIALLTLLAVLMVFFGIFCTCDQILEILGKNVFTHAAFVAAISASVMRFRD